MNSARACSHLILEADSGPAREAVFEGDGQLPPEYFHLPRDDPDSIGGTENQVNSMFTFGLIRMTHTVTGPCGCH